MSESRSRSDGISDIALGAYETRHNGGISVGTTGVYEARHIVTGSCGGATDILSVEQSVSEE